MGDAPLLELRNLNKVYEDGYHAVRDVSYSLGPGLLVGLIGPNGCGKTTMMRCINRLHDCTSGDVLIDGESVLSKTPGEIARKVANVPAELRTSFGLTVYETVMLGRYPHMRNLWWEPMEDEEFVSETLRKFGVDHLKDRAVGALSSGERQRVLIAMAFACNPHLIIADEPTTALDVTIQAQVLDILKELQRKQKTSLMLITHDLSIVMNMAARIYVMYCGKIVESARTPDLFRQPLHPYTHGLLGSVARIDDTRKRFVQIPSSLPSPMHKPEGCYFHPRCVYATERCRQQMPPLEELEGGRCVRCWNYKEICYDKQ